MYSHPSEIIIGPFRIVKNLENNRLTIWDLRSGEGGEFSEASLTEAIKEYFNEYF